ncbi:unnamed protein product [Caenorhabditis brenneri]
MSETPKKNEKPAEYKKAVAKQRRLKKLRQMKIRDRAGDVAVSDISDVDVQGDGEEESQDSWLNDLLKADGDNGGDGGAAPSGTSKSPDALQSMETTEESLPSKICAFASENSALIGVGIVTVALTLFARLRR